MFIFVYDLLIDDDSLADDIDYNSNNGHSEHVIYQRSGYLSNQSTASHAPIGGAMLGTRRPGLLNAAIGLGRPRGRPPLHYSAGSGGSGASTYSSIDQGSTAIAPIRPRSSGTGPYISSYTRSASRDYLLDALEEAELASPPQPKPAPQPWAPGKRGRPPLAMSLAKKAAAAQAEADETTSILQNIAIPPPHEPPPASFGMSTRNSNRLKRFSNYGVIDTAAAKAGKEEALMAAAFALVDAEETEEETQPIEKGEPLSVYL
ncbi:unnamed protein product [Protopolystoma xenopodis]|uniref:Uncharacterized protein n=1 Tax=Protopolystoma xenopodis TaxID=117903 RepID=A0A3S5CKL0_9PLAT|nr:unnamed protein product [Protopolystoma xenopodis]